MSPLSLLAGAPIPLASCRALDEERYHWVQCELCDKWRTVPRQMKEAVESETRTIKWTCSLGCPPQSRCKDDLDTWIKHSGQPFSLQEWLERPEVVEATVQPRRKTRH